MRWVMVLVCTAGCNQLFGLEAPAHIDAGMIDVPFADATADGQLCWGVTELGVEVCLLTPPSGVERVEADEAIDTDVVAFEPLACRPLATGSSNVCVIALESLVVAGGVTLSAHGSRPLVVLAGGVRITGTLDVASHLGGPAGPGATAVGCNPGTDPAPDPSPGGAGGGQGGSFGDQGGDGGNQEGLPTSRGLAGAALTVTTLRGGCPGANGGQFVNSKGAGGGALLVIADVIELGPASRINASGAGGLGAPPTTNGGGGGGSGGMIVLHSADIQASGHVFASGGGGGGASNDVGTAIDGMEATDALAAPSGGGGAGDAGDGGAGSPAPGPSRYGATGNPGGGGGGGGGAGVIRVYGGGSLAGATVSPPPT